MITARSGRLNVVVANAGVGEYARLGKVTEEQYHTTFAINVKGMLFTVQKALPLLPDGASVILLSSSAAVVGAPGLTVYGASKAANRSFARTWAAELAGRGIRVNAITPGAIATASADVLRAAMAHGEQWPGDGSGAGIPLGRMGRPDEGRRRRLPRVGPELLHHRSRTIRRRWPHPGLRSEARGRGRITTTRRH
jgi:NAD(P)-dependent dehydrogenase (short-subunit alcohol dehydrogenase family)